MRTINFIIASILSFIGIMSCSIATLLFGIHAYESLLEFYLSIAKDNPIIVWIILIIGIYLLYLAKLVGEQ